MFKEENTTEVHEIIDIEEYSKADKAIPASKSYKIRINRDYFRVGPEITGKQLLELVGKTPATDAIYEKLRNGQSRKIAPDEVVNLRKPGIERFYTIPLDPQDGRENSRKEFSLPENDTQFLNSLSLKWDAVKQGNVNWVVIFDHPLPEGYNIQQADICFRIEAGYPDQQIDMFYVFPGLSKLNGKTINNLSSMQFDNKNWQQWSRHRTGTNPWRPGIDDVSTHLSLVNEILTLELRR